MKSTRTSLAAVAILLAIGYGTVQAAELRMLRLNQQAAGIGSLSGGDKLEDTCTDSIASMPTACDIESLETRCDAAGGGMSSLPGGGVDCDIGD